MFVYVHMHVYMYMNFHMHVGYHSYVYSSISKAQHLDICICACIYVYAYSHACGCVYHSEKSRENERRWHIFNSKFIRGLKRNTKTMNIYASVHIYTDINIQQPYTHLFSYETLLLVCMYTLLYMYVCIHIHGSVLLPGIVKVLVGSRLHCVCMYAYMYVCLCMSMCCMYACLCVVCMHKHLAGCIVYVCMYACVCVCAWVSLVKPTVVRFHTHTHTHI
jgi:hypothetical protein